MTQTTETSDRNKFADLALSINADYLVTEDTDFNVFLTLPFPKLTIIRLADFLEILSKV